MDGDLKHHSGDGDKKSSPRKRNTKGKMVVLGCLTNSCEKKKSKRQRREGKIYPFEHRVPRTHGEIRKPSLVISSKK